MAIIYFRQKKCLQNVSLNFSVNLWSTLGSQSIHTQSSAITINPSRLTAGPLMSKHALWQIYGYMGNTAKLSRMYFFYALSSSSERTSKVRIICSKIFADVQTWCWIDWDLASKEFLALEKKKSTVSYGDPTESFITFQYRASTKHPPSYSYTPRVNNRITKKPTSSKNHLKVQTVRFKKRTEKTIRVRNGFLCAKRSCDFMQLRFLGVGWGGAKGSITQCENNRAQYLAGSTVRSAEKSHEPSVHRRERYVSRAFSSAWQPLSRDQRLSHCKTYANKAFFHSTNHILQLLS